MPVATTVWWNNARKTMGSRPWVYWPGLFWLTLEEHSSNSNFSTIDYLMFQNMVFPWNECILIIIGLAFIVPIIIWGRLLFQLVLPEYKFWSHGAADIIRPPQSWGRTESERWSSWQYDWVHWLLSNNYLRCSWQPGPATRECWSCIYQKEYTSF